MVNALPPTEFSNPSTVLPDGIDSAILTNPYTFESGHARKGTIASTINNVALLNILMKKDQKEDIEKAAAPIRELISSLKVTGMFDIFTPLEWLSASDQLGRVLVGVFFLQANPQEKTEKIQEKLSQIYEKTTSAYLKNQIEILIQ